MGLVALLFLPGLLQSPAPVLPEELVHITFDEFLPADSETGRARTPVDLVRRSGLLIEGVAAVDGVVGKAARFDGISGRYEYIDMIATSEFTAETWVALGACPPGWCTIVGQWRDLHGWSFDVGRSGELRFELGTDLGWSTCTTKERVLTPRRWTHVAAVCAGGSLRIFVDGRLQAEEPIRGVPRLATGSSLRMGAPSDGWWEAPGAERLANRPAVEPVFFLDGILDELRVHSRPMTADELTQLVEAQRPTAAPALSERHLPRGGPPGPGVFGATPCELPYYAGWDAKRAGGPSPDCVVRFDATGARVVFWGGLMHAPLWVTGEDVHVLGNDLGCEGRTSADGVLITGLLQRPDAPCSFVRVLASHAARVVLHRHYEVLHPQMGFMSSEPWVVDELITLYPDACGVRNVTWPVSTREREQRIRDKALGLQALLDTGQMPADVLDVDYLTLVRTDGQVGELPIDGSHHETPEFWKTVIREAMEDPPHEEPVLVRLNVVSDEKPFLASLHPGTVTPRGLPLSGLDGPVASTYQVPFGESGRSFSTIDPGTRPAVAAAEAWLGRIVARAGQPTQGLALVGMRSDGVDDLLALLRSWARAPELTVARGPWSCTGWDRSQRAWSLEREPGADTEDVAIRIAASKESPLVRPALLLHGWGERKVALAIDGEPALEGERFRQGFELQLGPSDLVLWLDLVATSPVELVLTPLE